jgi:endo-1,4-beta-xylanase
MTINLWGWVAAAVLLCAPGVSSAQAHGHAAGANAGLPTGFSWRSSSQIITPASDARRRYSAVKDPSIVYFNGAYHVFMTAVSPAGWGMAYSSFADWSEASSAPIISLEESGIGPGYRAAPQVFYFEPQQLWYMIFQSGPPMYSTTSDIEDPLSWSAPKPFFAEAPDSIKTADGHEAWLDFWVICDDSACHLFNTNDNGTLFRSQTPISQFPHGFSDPTIAMTGRRDDIFEASMHYRIAGTDTYLTVVEAIGPQGRYFRSWTSDRLDGEWRPLAVDVANSFAGSDNVSFDGSAWSEGVSHGELVRSGHDQTLTIDPCRPLQFLYQGLEAHPPGTDYINLPYRLGLLTATGPDPISALCPATR